MGFKKDFLWGGATAANQYEGFPLEGGGALATSDIMTNGSHTVRRQVTWKKASGETGSNPLCFGSAERNLPEGAVPTALDDPKYYYPSHVASDGYHHYAEDIALMAEMGFKSYRFSVKWSRVFPDPWGEPSEEGLKYYENVASECVKHGIEPLITLHHYETPLALSQKCNGWEGKECVDLFVKYATTMFKRLKGLVKYYLTFNEINCIDVAPFVTGGLIQASPQQVLNAAFNQFLATSLTVKAAHENFPDIKVGMMLAYGPCYGLTADPADQLEARKAEDHSLYYSDVQMLGRIPSYKLAEWEREGLKIPINDAEMQIIKDYNCDFLSFSCYGSSVVTCHLEGTEAGSGNGGAFGRVANPYLKTNAWGWATDPQCLRIALNVFNNRYHCPLWCVENGIGWNDKFEDGTVHDDYRIDYMRQNIKSMRDAVDIDGIDLMGYLYWGCIDVVSNGEGEMAKRYGQVYVDADNLGKGTFARSRKDSFFWYQKAIKSNGEDLD